ncbi:hypothetical protein FB451DRAFT_1365222 [Mycena latifolia]|nr:hypothetical protein FB451DRAFT_1365222 [Mycena latifolia]
MAHPSTPRLDTRQKTIDSPSGHKRALDRAQRAVCRILVNRHGLSRAEIGRHCGWDHKAVGTAAGNKYMPPDRVEDDEREIQGRPGLVTIVDELIGKKGSRGKQRICKREPSYDFDSPLNTPSNTSNSSSNSTPRATSTRRRTREMTGRPNFLDQFVDDAALDSAWKDAFVRAGLTEEGLRRLAGRDSAFIADSTQQIFPNMSTFERGLFITAVRALVIWV